MTNESGATEGNRQQDDVVKGYTEAKSIQSIPSLPTAPNFKFFSRLHLYIFIVTSFFFYFLLAFPPKPCMHSSSPISCYTPFPSHHPRLYHRSYTLRSVMKLFIFEFLTNIRYGIIPLILFPLC